MFNEKKGGRMPNNIQNRLRVEGNSEKVNALMDLIRGKKERIDFNKIIPMPDIMQDFEPHSGIVTAIKKKYNTPINSNWLIARLEMKNREKQSLEFEGKEKEQFDLGCKIFKETGFVYWCDWAIEKWGTKWNAYSTPDKRDTGDIIYFETAWSGIPDLIKKLSSMFPELEMFYEWADEDTGCNTGKCIVRAGELWIDKPENESREAYDLAFDLRPEDKKNYFWDGQEYQYKDEEN